jgi:hypothetical protein
MAVMTMEGFAKYRKTVSFEKVLATINRLETRRRQRKPRNTQRNLTNS